MSLFPGSLFSGPLFSIRLVPALLLAASGPAYAADQYDLACKGTTIARLGAAPTPIELHVRVDLAAKKWCEGACERALDIYEVKPDMVVLADDITFNSRLDLSNNVTVDRKTNAYHRFQSQTRPDEIYLKIDAACSQAPFTPFPAAKAPAAG